MGTEEYSKSSQSSKSSNKEAKLTKVSDKIRKEKARKERELKRSLSRSPMTRKSVKSRSRSPRRKPSSSRSKKQKKSGSRSRHSSISPTRLPLNSSLGAELSRKKRERAAAAAAAGKLDGREVRGSPLLLFRKDAGSVESKLATTVEPKKVTSIVKPEKAAMDAEPVNLASVNTDTKPLPEEVAQIEDTETNLPAVMADAHTLAPPPPPLPPPQVEDVINPVTVKEESMTPKDIITENEAEQESLTPPAVASSPIPTVVTADPIKNSTPPPPAPPPIKVEASVADLANLGEITQQLNQSELAVLLNLLQSHTDLSMAQISQLLNVHDNPEMQQQLEALNKSINTLQEINIQPHEAHDLSVDQTSKEPPLWAPRLDQAAHDVGNSQGDMQSMLAVILSQVFKPQDVLLNVEESNGERSCEQQGAQQTPTVPQQDEGAEDEDDITDGAKRSTPPAAFHRVSVPEKRPPEPPGPPPPPLIERDISGPEQDLNPALLQLSTQETEQPPTHGLHVLGATDYNTLNLSRTYSTEVPPVNFSTALIDGDRGQTLIERPPKTLTKIKNYSSPVSRTGEASSYQGTGSAQFPGDQDLRFSRVPLALNSVVRPALKVEAINTVQVYPEAKIQTYSELGPGAAGSSVAGTVHNWSTPSQVYGKAYHGRVPPRGGQGRGVPY